MYIINYTLIIQMIACIIVHTSLSLTYAAGIGSFVRNSLLDIITDVLKQATVKGYSHNIETHPYQLTGMLQHLIMWIIIFTMSMWPEIFSAKLCQLYIFINKLSRTCLYLNR